MNELFDKAINISTPLALAGFFATVLFYVFIRILKNKPTSDVIKLIVWLMFILSLIAMTLGSIAWFYKSRYLQLTVYLDNQPMDNAIVSIPTLNLPSQPTNSNGYVLFKTLYSELPQKITFQIKSSMYSGEIDSTFFFKDIPSEIYLSSKNFKHSYVENQSMKVIVIVDNEVKEGISVAAPLMIFNKATDRDGTVEIPLKTFPANESIELILIKKELGIKIDTMISLKQFPITFHLHSSHIVDTSKVKFSNEIAIKEHLIELDYRINQMKGFIDQIAEQKDIASQETPDILLWRVFAGGNNGYEPTIPEFKELSLLQIVTWFRINIQKNIKNYNHLSTEVENLNSMRNKDSHKLDPKLVNPVILHLRRFYSEINAMLN